MSTEAPVVAMFSELELDILSAVPRTEWVPRYKILDDVGAAEASDAPALLRNLVQRRALESCPGPKGGYRRKVIATALGDQQAVLAALRLSRIERAALEVLLSSNRRITGKHLLALVEAHLNEPVSKGYLYVFLARLCEVGILTNSKTSPQGYAPAADLLPLAAVHS